MSRSKGTEHHVKEEENGNDLSLGGHDINEKMRGIEKLSLEEDFLGEKYLGTAYPYIGTPTAR